MTETPKFLPQEKSRILQSLASGNMPPSDVKGADRIFETRQECLDFLTLVKAFGGKYDKENITKFSEGKFDDLPPWMRGNVEKLLRQFNHLLLCLGMGDYLLLGEPGRDVLCRQFVNFVNQDFSALQSEADDFSMSPATGQVFRMLHDGKPHKEILEYIDANKDSIDIRSHAGGQNLIALAIEKQQYEIVVALRSLPTIPGAIVNAAILELGGREMSEKERYRLGE